MDYKKLINNMQLMEAIQENNTSNVRRALDAGADVNFVDKNIQNMSPMRLARSLGATEIVDILKQQTCSEKPGKPIKSSPSEVAVYNKRPGTACLGQFYETKLLAMVLLRVLKDKSIERFYLGTNLDEAGAFDDIVLRYTEGGQEKVCFLQAKHVKQKGVKLTDMINEPKGDFSLQKYFESYVKIRKQFNSDNQNVIFRGNFDKIESRFLISTTDIINFNGLAQPSDMNGGKIFCTKLRKPFCISSNQIITKFITKLNQELAKEKPALRINPDDISVEIVQDFFKKLVFFIDQSFENEIDSIIIDEIVNANNSEESKPRIINANGNTRIQFLKFHDVIQEWWKQTKMVPFLMKNCDFLEKTTMEVEQAPLLELIHSISINRIKSTNVSFALQNVKWIEEIAEIVKSCRKETKIISSSHPELTALKVVQHLERQGDNEQSFRFINTTQIDIQCITDAITPTNPSCLILAHVGLNVRQIVDEISKIVTSVVVITNCKCEENCAKDEKLSLYDLDSVTRDRVLERMITFQGNEISLRSLVNEDLELVDADTLSRLLVNESIEIASPHNEDEEVLQYYVQRKIRQPVFKVEILQNAAFTVLTDDQDEIIANGDRSIIVLFKHDDQEHSQWNRNNVKKNSFQNYQQAEAYYKLLCEQFPTRNIHLFSCNKSKESELPSENEIIWHKSHNDITPLRKFIDEHRRIEFELRTVDDLSDEVVILAAEPGMGKSSFLTSLFEASNVNHSSVWIERINLLSYSQKFQDWECASKTIDKSDVLEFLIDASNDEESGTQALVFSRKIFRKFCIESKLILLVDGFDEICPNYKCSVLQLLRIISRNFAAKLLVTTRPGIAQEDLESYFNRFAYTLKTFTEEDQLLFLSNFWGARLGIQADESKCRSFSNQLFSQLSNSIEYRSIPLQIKMIAITFEKTFEKTFETFHKSCNSEFSLQQTPYKNLIHLYDNFIHILICNVLVQEKSGIKITNLHAHKIINDTKDKIMTNHMHAAIHVLFNEKEKRFLLNANDIYNLDHFLAEVRMGSEKTGIVYRNTSGNLMFIHQTYAEYFAALWISEKYRKLPNEDFNEFLNIAVIENLLKTNKIQICKFLQQKIELQVTALEKITYKSCLLLEKLMDTFTKLKNFVEDHAAKELLKIVEFSCSEKELEIVNLIDRWSQTKKLSLLAAASSMGCDRLLALTYQKVDTDAPYKGFLVCLAVRANRLKTVEFLINNRASVNVYAPENGMTPLHWTAMKGFRDIAELLIANGANVNEHDAEDGFTPLHWAAQKDFGNIAELLISNGANVNICKHNNVTPLHTAAWNNSKEVAKLLLANCADVHVCTTNRGSTPLHSAAQEGSRDIAELLIANGANVNAHDAEDGFTPLHWAAAKDFGNIAELLISNGANVNICKHNNVTPLHTAALNDSKNVAKLLLAKGADVHACATDKGNTPLHWAAQKGFCDIAEMMIASRANVNAHDAEDGFTPLHWAAAKDFGNIAELLISNGANVNICKHNNLTPLHTAAGHGSKNVAKLLLAKGADVHACTTDKGNTPLHWAAQKGFCDIAEMLIASRANVNAHDAEDGFTPLHWAAAKDFGNIAELLISNGANVNICKHYNVTPLHMAAWCDSKNVAKLLLAKGANVNAHDAENGFTPLHWAAQKDFGNIAELLISNGANVNICKHNNVTPLHLAALCDSKKVAKLLLAKGADVHACTTDKGNTPLHWAAEKGFREIAELLIANGANVNVHDIDTGCTPLHWAAIKGFRDIAELLIANGAKVMAQTTDTGTTPLHWAAQEDFGNIAELLISNGAHVNLCEHNNVTPLHTAAWHDSKKVAKLLLAKGADVHACTTDKRNTPLHWAAEKGFREIAELLIANGAKVMAQTTDTGTTPLHWAAQEDFGNIAELLISNVANVNLCEHNNVTPLHTAAWHDSKKVAKLLLAKGADVHACTTDKGNTPLHWAAEKGFRDIAELLIANGANVNVHDIDTGCTPLHWAALKGFRDSAELLIANGAKVMAQTTDTGTTPLHWAAQEDFGNIAELLISNGANVNICKHNNVTPLHTAVWCNSKEVAKLLLANGANVHACTTDLGRTPLHWAAKKGFCDITEMLIANGANVNARTFANKTPSQLASEHGHVEIERLLCDKARLSKTSTKGILS